MADLIQFPPLPERIKRQPLKLVEATAWSVGEEAEARRAKPLNRFGSALVRSPIREAIQQADRDSNNPDPPDAA